MPQSRQEWLQNCIGNKNRGWGVKLGNAQDWTDQQRSSRVAAHNARGQLAATNRSQKLRRRSPDAHASESASTRQPLGLTLHS